MSHAVYRIAIWTGGSALLLAAATDTAAVIARNLSVSIHGSIELIQVAVLVAGALGIVISLATRTHARVHVLTDRLSAAGKTAMQRFAALAVAAFLACLLAGSSWIAIDLWHGHELSEVVGVPWRWMRLFANACLAVGILILLHQIWRPRT